MTEAKVICCGHELQEDDRINEKWVCSNCGRVFVVIAKRPLPFLGGVRSD